MNAVTQAIKTEEYRLHYGGRDLRSDKSLKEYSTLGNGSTIDVYLSLCGGSISNTRKVDPTIKTSNGPCIVYLVDFPNQGCVVMPCGHAINPDGLADYCKSEIIDNHKLEVHCYIKGCDKEWPISYISKCGLTTQELNLINKTISLNFINYGTTIRQCPGCGLYCSRVNPSDKIVRCAQCSSKKAGLSYDFCWQCLAPYTSGHKCSVEAINQILASAPQKETSICKMKCPSIRACPKCFLLIEHIDRCKHMQCPTPTCKQEFCFVCLRLKTDGKWHCGTYSTECEMAPVQVLKK